jgi:sugar phosphate permease
MSTQTALQEAPAQPSFLATRRGKLMLAFLCMVGFLDFVDASIVNVALPSIRRDLHFSLQNLQWILSGYLLTYGGFMLLGGRAADLLGRRRILDARRRTDRPGPRRRDDGACGAVDPDDDVRGRPR